MTVGISTVNLANAWLNVVGNKTTFTAPAGTHIQCHTADPGALGTTAASTGVTGRQAATFGAASGAAIALTNSPAFTATGGDTITHISVWSAASAGTFLWSAALSTAKTVVATDTLTFNAVGVSLSPVAS